MILVADSGSTKADWIAGKNGETTGEFNSKGFNPFFHDKKFILKELNDNAGLLKIRSDVDKLYFFGAGCSSPDRNAIIFEGLTEFFKNAEIVVDHDMLGSALAVCEGKPGIACILGTGSNICYFNGQSISETRHGLGYIIGDEGSGSYYGKKLLAWYLYGILPEELQNDFKNKYVADKETIINRVYSQPNANVFLASFAGFLSEHATHPFVVNLVHRGMSEFFETNVLSYKESQFVPVHFSGSIAWYFKDVLKKVAMENGVTTGNIIRKPVTGLADYFFKGGKMPVT